MGNDTMRARRLALFFMIIAIVVLDCAHNHTVQSTCYAMVKNHDFVWPGDKALHYHVCRSRLHYGILAYPMIILNIMVYRPSTAMLCLFMNV